MDSLVQDATQIKLQKSWLQLAQDQGHACPYGCGAVWVRTITI